MRRELFEVLMMVALTGRAVAKPKVKIVDNPQHTKNWFGPISEIAGKELELMERNSQGDCLCIFTGKQGTNLVDVDHRDIANAIGGAK